MLKAAQSECEPAPTRSNCHLSFASRPRVDVFRRQQCVFSTPSGGFKRLGVALRRCWHRKAIVVIDCGHMWRLWSGYVAAQNGISQIFGVPPPPTTTNVFFTLLFIWGWTQHFNHNSVLLVAAEALFSVSIILFIAGTKPCLYSILPLMVYLHSFLLSNRVAITFPRHEKGDCVRPSV